MRWLAVLVGLAACGGGTGVDLEIRSEVDIASVEIFVGNQRCYELSNGATCVGGVGWLPGQPRPPGDTYVTIASVPIESRLEPMRDGSSFVIHLSSDSDHADTDVIAVVGFDSAGKAVAVGTIWGQRIPVNSGVHWTVTLARADEAVLSDKGPGTNEPEHRVFVWGRDGDTPEEVAGARCVVVQKWEGSYWKNTFIVPNSDRDCDDEPLEAECDDRYYHLHDNLINDQLAACVDTVDATTNPLAGACVVGRTPCRDGGSNSRDCLHLSGAQQGYTCVPDKLCEVCTLPDGSPAPYGIDACTASVKAVSGISHAVCELGADSSTGMSCGIDRAGYAASLSFPFDCEYIDVLDPAAAGGPPLTLPLALGPASVDVKLIAATGCHTWVKFTAGTAPVGSHWILLAAHVEPSGSFVGNRILFPVRIDFEAITCTPDLRSPEPCMVEIGGDNIVRCAGLEP